MAPSYVLRFKLDDPKDAAILINVTPKASNELDLDLLATDGDAAFRGKVRARSLDKLRAKNYDGSTEEWTSILRYALVSRLSDIDQAVRDNLEIVCSVDGKDPKATLSIAFRTRVQDITQRLGSIELQQTEDTDEVDLFGWAAQLADRRDQLEDEANKQEKKAGAEAETITALQTQLSELTAAKTNHEQQLVSKFAQLLNEKKHQLRKLQRVLETAQVDPDKLREIKQSASSRSRPGKKRSAHETGEATASDDSEGFEQMDVDKPAGTQVSDDEEDRGQQTTDTEEEQMESDDLDQPVTSQTEGEAEPSSKARGKAKAPQHMPAPRELPFNKQAQQTAKGNAKASTSKSQAANSDNDETASEEDEL